MIRGSRARYFFLFAGFLVVVVLALLVQVRDRQDHYSSRRLLEGITTGLPTEHVKNESLPDGHKDMGGDAWGLEEDGKVKHCRHGVWDKKNKICECYEGWATASVTDTIDFFEGVCEQYHCQSSETCQDVLGIADASCPVKNWNCYCGWKYAFYNLGHGWETQQKEGGGECMGLMYTFSIWASELLEGFLAKAYYYFLIVAVCMTPFGRKRTNCDHHRPSIWNTLRRWCQCINTCQGECVGPQEPWSWIWFVDNIAWTVYVLDCMVWFYLFAVTLYLVVLTIWSFVLWALVILATIVVLIAAVCATCAEGMAGCSCDCCAGGAGGGGCADCCMIGAAHGSAAPTSMSDSLWYTTGGPWPYDPFWGYSGYGHVSADGDCECCGGCCITLCRPIACLLFLFPVAPENMWGGLIGYWMGTHVNTSNDQVYTGGSCFVEFLRMGWRRTADLHGAEEWRTQVHDFIVGEGNFANNNNVRNNNTSTGRANLRYNEVTNEQEFTVLFEGQNRRGTSISRARAIHIERPFSLEQDNPVESSFKDYQNQECWICRTDNVEWDMWVSCHHIFCKDCSTEMLHRKMPCPLCRVASSTVLRGKKWTAGGGPGGESS